MVWIREWSGSIADSAGWFRRWFYSNAERGGPAARGRAGAALEGPVPRSEPAGAAAGGEPREPPGTPGPSPVRGRSRTGLVSAALPGWAAARASGQVQRPCGCWGRARPGRSTGPRNTDMADPTEQGSKERCKNRRQIPFSFSSVSQLLISCPNFSPSLYTTVAKPPTQAHTS